MKSLIEKIDKQGLCLGCGLCESVCGKDAVQMDLRGDGFFHPTVKKVLPEKERIISKICPGTNIVNDILFNKDQSIWGNVEQLYSGFAIDNEVRTKGSSGGIVSSLAIYVLENKIVDGVMQVGGDESDYERNSLNISTNRDNVLKCASSRYAPALIFSEIFRILEADDNTYCFIGKPCDISALKNFLSQYPQYSNRFKLTVSIMCAGLPSFKGTQAIIDDFKAVTPVSGLVYRGNGWPGFFSFIDKRGLSFQRTYNDSWGKTLNKFLKFRCKICPDGIGLQADIAVGDAWETTDGYPDFTEKEGHSLIIVRTQNGVDILQKALNDKTISLENLDVEKIKLMQPYQYVRRTRLGARMAAFSLVTQRILNFKNMHILYNLTLVDKKILLKEFLGTFRRLVKS